MDKIKWFWSHRRNTSLLHMSFFALGLRGKKWLPAVDFWFDNQIFVGVPKNGCYIFYDRNQLSSKDKYKDIQKSIDKNSNFVADFSRRTDEIFGAVLFKCSAIEENNLSLLSNEELYKLYEGFIETISSCPIITVQLWGIEACLDQNYKIMKFLEKRLRAINELEKLYFYKEIISTNTGETVALTEQKDFYRVASALTKSKFKKHIGKENINNLSKMLEKYPENELFEKHIKKYEWVNKEYVSGGWSREKWLSLFIEALKSEISPENKLKELLENFKKLNKQKKDAIIELNPPSDVLHSIESLAEFISQRDWSKGNFTKFLLSFHKLLDEIGKRAKLDRSDLFNYTYEEIKNYLLNGKLVDKNELIIRKKFGFFLAVKKGKTNLITGEKKIKKAIIREEIREPFDKYSGIESFKGLSASRGFAMGKAHVIEDALKISEFKDGEILVTYMTTMEFTPVFRKAKAVITDEGGMSCHAAIVSREFRIPCIVGTKIATRVIKTGDLVKVDANQGVVKIIKGVNKK